MLRVRRASQVGSSRENRASARLPRGTWTGIVNPEIWLLVAESGLYRTDPASRKLLETLGTDADENVRKAAQATLDEWRQWQSRPLMRKELP